MKWSCATQRKAKASDIGFGLLADTLVSALGGSALNHNPTFKPLCASKLLVVPASELFLLKRLARLLRGRIEVKDLVVGARPDPGSGRRVAVAAEGDATVVETDLQSVAARQFVDRDTAAIAIDDTVCGLLPKAIAARRQPRLLPRRLSEKAKL